jgi:hypothetical protein
MKRLIITEEEETSIRGMYLLEDGESTPNRGGFCLTKFKDTSLQSYKWCAFEGVSREKFEGMVDFNSNNHIYSTGGGSVNYSRGNSVYFVDSSGNKVYMIRTGVIDMGGVPIFLDDSILKQILDYMVTNKYIESYSKNKSLRMVLYELPNNYPNISKRGSSGQIIVTLPDAPKDATGPSPITNFTYWPKAHIYYYNKDKPTDYIFTDDGSIDQTFLTLIKNRK